MTAINWNNNNDRNNNSDVKTNNNKNKRFALIIATSEYEDSDFQRLIAPGKDAESLAHVLQNPSIGEYDVKILLNEPKYKVEEEIELFFNEHKKDDLLLLYFSCHGIKDKDGQLYYATTNTRRKRLKSTAISSNFVNSIIQSSISQKKILLIDCCYSGAFERGFIHRADDKEIHTKEYLKGLGTFVITASDAMQYSFEGDQLNEEKEELKPSIFTGYLIEALSYGKADHDNDGLVSPEDLYKYVYDKVTDITAHSQTPQKWSYDVKGDIIIAKNPLYELILDAKDSLNKQEYNKAMEKSNEIIRISPNSLQAVSAYNIKGLSLFKKEKYNDALECFDNALQLHPTFIEALNNKGLVLSSTGNHDKAIEIFDRSLSLNSNDPIVWNYKGSSFDALEKYTDALECYNKAIDLNSSYTEAIHYRNILKKKIEQRQQQQEQEQEQRQQQYYSGFSSNKRHRRIDPSVDLHDLPGLTESNWKSLLNDIYNKKCIPFIGDSVHEFYRFPISEEISKELAYRYKYPFEDFYQLSKVAQFLAIEYGKEEFPKELVCKFISDKLEKIKIPDIFYENNSPYTILGQLNLPIYITTNFDIILENALLFQHKNPISEICTWNDDLKRLTEMNIITSAFGKHYGVKSCEDKPLVYHLYGNINYPRSMVLTEEDHKKFVINLNREYENKIIPGFIRTKLSLSSFLFIGYELDQIYSILQAFNFLGNTIVPKKIILVVSFKDQYEDSKIIKYKIQNISNRFQLMIYWGNTDDFLQELKHRLENLKNKEY